MTAYSTDSLADIALFAEIDAEKIKQIETCCTWRQFAAQEQIIDRQSDTKDVYFVTSGIARVVNYSVSGREISFDDLRAGSIFGEISAIDDAPRSAHVIAIEPTTVAIMSPLSFQKIITENPNIALILMKRLASVIRTSVVRIMDLSTLGAHNRIYAELLRLAKINSSDEQIAIITPAPNHSDIASRVSTTRETVTRVFSELAKNGMINKTRTQLIVNNMDRLQHMVEQFRGE